jgi:hypothetical protein
MKFAMPSAALLAAVLIGSAAYAQNSAKAEPAKTVAGKAPAGGIEAQVAAKFAERAGNKPDQVFKAQAGLYEVLVRGEIFYVDADKLAPGGGQAGVRRLLFNDKGTRKSLLQLIREKNAAQGRDAACSMWAPPTGS